MPHLSEAQSKGLALWTFGTITAKSGCRNSVRPDLHGWILRRPAKTPRVALRRRRPLHSVPESDRRPRPLSRRWVEGQDEPWIILTDFEPEEASWREMRFWIESGFNALKSVGWQWRKTRRTDPARVAH